MYLAYIDEAGAKLPTDPRQRYFVMSAVLLRATDKPLAVQLLADMRLRTNKNPVTVLHWKSCKSEDNRHVMSSMLGAADFLTTISVVVSHDHLPEAKKIREERQAYMQTFQFLLERLSWFGQSKGQQVEFCVERVVRMSDFRFKMLLGAIHSKQPWDAYDARARSDHHARRSGTKWGSVGSSWKLSTPEQVELLQLADMTASATFAAFSTGDRRWLRAISPRIWKKPGKPNSTYGLKIHPWGTSAEAQRDLAWVNEV
jgi:hypothetical protein